MVALALASAEGHRKYPPCDSCPGPGTPRARMMGCEGEAEGHHPIGGLRLTVCPHRYLRESGDADLCREALALHSSYRQGHLLRAGGIEDQPALYYACVLAIEGELARQENERIEKMEAEAKKRQRRQSMPRPARSSKPQPKAQNRAK